MIKLLKRLLFGRPETDEEREQRRKAKIYMLSARAGAALKADDDGVVRIRDCQDEDDSICNGGGA